MPVGANSPLLPLVADSGWQQHAKLFDETWKGLDERQLSNIRTWTAKNITDPRLVLFYFFSGPDFLYANAFFPSANTYVLAGLEPVGRIPDVASLPPKSVPGTLRHLEVLAQQHPEAQLLHHPRHGFQSCARRSSTAPCRCSTSSWRARGKPFAT